MRTDDLRRFASLAVFAAVLGTAASARAGGLFFSDRGTRPLARGGAFVAGADDLGAVYYNPAGIVEAGTSVLVDATYMHFGTDYTRTARVPQLDPNTGQTITHYDVRQPTVSGHSAFLPIPTLAVSYGFSDKVAAAIGVYAPNAALPTFPATVNGQPAPQRYSAITEDGSALVVLGAYVSVRPIPQWEIGAGPTLMVGKFVAEHALSACVPQTFICAQEQPEWDAETRLSAGIVAPSGTIGTTIIPIEQVRIGAAFQLPYSINSDADIDVRLPSSALFDNASVSNPHANLKFKLPWIARGGVEVRPARDTRIEVAFDYEKWSMHDQIAITPKGSTLDNVALLPSSYPFNSLNLARHFQDSWSIRLGGEQRVVASPSTAVSIRAGVSYEKSAVPAAYLSTLSLDADKVMLATGAGLHLGDHLRLDGTFAYYVVPDQQVSVDQAKLFPVQVVRANVPPGSIQPVNAGHYAMSAFLVGLGMNYKFR